VELIYTDIDRKEIVNGENLKLRRSLKSDLSAHLGLVSNIRLLSVVALYHGRVPSLQEDAVHEFFLTNCRNLIFNLFIYYYFYLLKNNNEKNNK